MTQLPPIITPNLLTQISTHPALRPKTWDIISAVTLCILNRPDEIPKIYTASLSSLPSSPDESQAHAEKLQLTRRMREALLKVAAVGGFPKTINALMELKSCTPVDLLDGAASSSPSPASRASELRSDPSTILTRGKAFFDAVYGKIAGRVMKQLDECGAEDLGAVVRLVYGHIISDEAVLGKAETSFCMIAGLIPQDVNPQLKGHLKGALNGGATVAEVRAAREVVIMICEAAGMRKFDSNTASGWGWREEVANL